MRPTTQTSLVPTETTTLTRTSNSFTLPGLNFGLKSAPLAFNRYPRIAVMLARHFLGIYLDHFYDDFCICEPDFTRDSGQIHLATTLQALGLPLAAAKHKTADLFSWASRPISRPSAQLANSRLASRRSAATESPTKANTCYRRQPALSLRGQGHRGDRR